MLLKIKYETFVDTITKGSPVELQRIACTPAMLYAMLSLQNAETRRTFLFCMQFTNVI